jgi:hypothetical protein
MIFFDMDSIDKIPVNLAHVRTIEACDAGGSPSIVVTFSNGDVLRYRYESKADRTEMFYVLDSL